MTTLEDICTLEDISLKYLTDNVSEDVLRKLCDTYREKEYEAVLYIHTPKKVLENGYNTEKDATEYIDFLKKLVNHKIINFEYDCEGLSC